MKRKPKKTDIESKKQKCFRCRELLDEDESFCVACGAHNPLEPLEERLKIDMKIEKRLKYLRLWNRLISIFTRRPRMR